MKDVIELAKQAGFHLDGMQNMLYTVRGNHAQLERLIKLVRNDALEELSEKCTESLTRADWKPSSIFRHYYPSANGDWVDLRELKKFIESLKEPTP